MIDCSKAVDFIEKKQNNELSFWKKIQLKQHLLVCNLCRVYAQKSKIIEGLIKSSLLKIKPSKDLKKKIKSELKNKL